MIRDTNWQTDSDSNTESNSKEYSANEVEARDVDIVQVLHEEG